MKTEISGLNINENIAYLDLSRLNGLNDLADACDLLEQWMDETGYLVSVIVDMANTSLSVSTLTRLQQLYSYAHPNLDTLIIVHTRSLVKFAFDSIRIPNHMAAPTLVFMDTVEQAQAYIADDDATVPVTPMFPMIVR